MRLGQLARKLALRPAEIVEFLSQNNIHIDDGTNSRLEDSHVEMVIAKLAPHYKEEIIAEASSESEEEIVAKIDEEIPVVEARKEDEPTQSPQVSMPTAPPAIEVIKAPKVELSGLKVLGKIDLPEKKKPAAPVEPTTGESEVENVDKPVERPRRPSHQKNDRERREIKPRKNPIVVQREREAQEEQEKRRAQAKLEKERRTDYYHRRVKASVPTKAARLIEEPVEQLSMSDLREPPKTLLGRFWRWFTT